MAKPKKVLFELIRREDVFLSGQPYELLDEIRACRACAFELPHDPRPVVRGSDAGKD